MKVVLTGGTVLGTGGLVETDVLVEGNLVVAVGPGLARHDAYVVDCEGCWIGPGFVDLHVHLREPGQEWKEDIASGSAAAAAGGFTTIVAMPNTEPATDSRETVRFVLERGRQAGLLDVRVAGCLTKDRAGKELAPLDDLVTAGVRLFTDDGDSVADVVLLQQAMEYLAGVGGIVAQHAEDPVLAGGGHMHEGSVSESLGIKGLPARAEEAIIERDLKLVEATGCHYHVQHVSTAGSVTLVRSAKAAGLPVTAEVTPHHLSLDHSVVEGLDAVNKMYPPLRTPEDVTALRAALADGTIDAVATDHAPHAAAEKDLPFEEAPRGVIGLETAAAVVNTEVGMDPVRFFTRMAVAPAAILGVEHGWVAPGRPADLVVFDPSEQWTPKTFVSKSANSPWLDRQLRGRVLATLYRGEITYSAEGVS